MHADAPMGLQSTDALHDAGSCVANIGIIGAGHIGSALAVRLGSLGHTVFIANSRGPETLGDLARKTGAKPVTVLEAARHGEIVVVTIPLKNIPGLPKDLFEGVGADVPVIDTSNYYLAARRSYTRARKW